MADSVVLVTKWKAANETDFLIHVTGIVCKIKNKTTRAAKENRKSWERRRTVNEFFFGRQRHVYLTLVIQSLYNHMSLILMSGY
jgi:hypothetical protein